MKNKATAEVPQPSPHHCPETVLDLFEALLTHGTTEDKRVLTPLPDFRKDLDVSWRDPKYRMEHFQHHFQGGTVEFAPLGGNEFNSGATNISTDPNRALIENVQNGIEAVIDGAVEGDRGRPIPRSPREAAERYWGLSEDSFNTMPKGELCEMAKKFVVFRAFTKNCNFSDPHDPFFDIRDFGSGILPEKMVDTVLSIGQGNKQKKPYLMGRFGIGGSNAYQYSRLSAIASRRKGSDRVGFTFVFLDNSKVRKGEQKSATYVYMTINGQIPEVSVQELAERGLSFEHGTLIRHFGYASDAVQQNTDKSIYGLGHRFLPCLILPIWSSVHVGVPTKRGLLPEYKEHGHTIVGTGNRLRRLAYEKTRGLKSDGDVDGGKLKFFDEGELPLGDMDFGGETLEPAGFVKIRCYVLCNKTIKGGLRGAREAVRTLASPQNPIQFVLDGQNHAEESRRWITAPESDCAKLNHVGKYMVVQLIGDGMSPLAKNELVSSSREHLKDGPIKRKIIQGLVDFLSANEELTQIDAELARGEPRNPEEEASFEEDFRKFFSAGKVNLDRLFGVPKGTETGPRGKEPLPDLAPSEDPMHLHWLITNKSGRDGSHKVTLYPGQVQGWRFLTDVSPRFWDPSGESGEERTLDLTWGPYVAPTSYSKFAGGKIKCTFKCAEDAPIGKVTRIKLEFRKKNGEILSDALEVHIVPPPKDVNSTGGHKPYKGSRPGNHLQLISNTPHRILPPKGLDSSNRLWAEYWGETPDSAGMHLELSAGAFQVYYNTEDHIYRDMANRCKGWGLENAFQTELEYQLTLWAYIRSLSNLVGDDTYKDCGGALTALRGHRDDLKACFQSLVILAQTNAVRMQTLTKAANV